MKKTVLIVDDDLDLLEMLQEYLEQDGYDTITTNDSANVQDILLSQAVDLVVQDLLMPGDDGIALIGKHYNELSIPVIMMSGRAEATDRIIGIEAGADDYLAKPFLPRELSVRVKAIFRRIEQMDKKLRDEAVTYEGPDVIQFDRWSMDRAQYQVFSDQGESAGLTVSEFKVLERLVLSQNVVLTRQQLFETIRDLDADVFDRAVDIQISRIRKKLHDTPKKPRYIKTVRSAGYVFQADVKA
ncbi:MAG: response regulator transcription factor [Pseudomonadota bacterium]